VSTILDNPFLVAFSFIFIWIFIATTGRNMRNESIVIYLHFFISSHFQMKSSLKFICKFHPMINRRWTLAVVKSPPLRALVTFIVINIFVLCGAETLSDAEIE
jgi:hypothetical protein